MIGVAVTLALFAFFWALRGKLNTMGLEYVHWRRTSRAWTAAAITAGIGIGAVVGWQFRDYAVGPYPPFSRVWIAVTWGPLIEEVLFRGYLFALAEMLLNRWIRRPGWPVVIGVAAVFALSHLARTDIKPVQIGTVFLTGLFYGWLRLDSLSTVPSVCAHISYNSVIYVAAELFRRHG